MLCEVNTLIIMHHTPHRHPAAVALAGLLRPDSDLEATVAAADDLLGQLLTKQDDSTTDARVLLLGQNAAPQLLERLPGLLDAPDARAADKTLEILAQLFFLRPHQEAALSAGCPEALLAVLTRPAAPQTICAAALRCGSALACKHENAKVALLTAGVAASAVGLISQGPWLAGGEQIEKEESTEAAAARAVLEGTCSLLIALTTADDDSLPGSSAFPNARSLGKDALPPLVAALQCQFPSPSTRIVLCSAIKQVLTCGQGERG